MKSKPQVLECISPSPDPNPNQPPYLTHHLHPEHGSNTRTNKQMTHMGPSSRQQHTEQIIRPSDLCFLCWFVLFGHHLIYTACLHMSKGERTHFNCRQKADSQRKGRSMALSSVAPPTKREPTAKRANDCKKWRHTHTRECQADIIAIFA